MLSDIWSYIAGQFTGMDFWATIQTVGLILSFIYLWLEFHQKPLMWVISAMCSMIYASVYASHDIVYRHFRGMEFLAVLGVSAIIWGAIFCILRFLTDSPVPVLDALTTMLNIVGTWVLAQKIIEVWGIWFLVNLISIYIYSKRGLHLTTILLYSFYLGASVYGYIKWRVKGKLLKTF